jgi:hypothetical protein
MYDTGQQAHLHRVLWPQSYGVNDELQWVLGLVLEDVRHEATQQLVQLVLDLQ